MLALSILIIGDVHFNVLLYWDDEGKGNNAVELFVLDVLIELCELAKPIDIRFLELDNIFKFNRGEVVVYEDDTMKPW